MIEDLLPPPVAAAEHFGDAPLTELFRAEAEAVAGAVVSRRRKFCTVRSCARKALSRLGLPPVPIPRGPRGEPMWPDGIVGSMTHCHGYRAAAVARSGDVLGIGLDAEPDEPLRYADMLHRISLPEERGHIAELLAERPGIHWERLLFSAKESIYKAWYPLTGEALGFTDARVTFAPDEGTFTVRLLPARPYGPDGRHPHFDGRWRAANGLLATALTVHRPSNDHPTPPERAI
ncbi:4'-phosphopantetheinyl transferase [Streptomyces sp. NPDC018045]|uniref:4'-phosphopantetheinyl transferase n=1 Tax=Streptomyces sp. NPDC018045 TaxID=3365037 RepID=UPI00379BEC4B